MASRIVFGIYQELKLRGQTVPDCSSEVLLFCLDGFHFVVVAYPFESDAKIIGSLFFSDLVSFFSKFASVVAQCILNRQT